MANVGFDHKITATRTQGERLWARCTDRPAIASRYEPQFSAAAVAPSRLLSSRVAAPEARLAGARAAAPPTIDTCKRPPAWNPGFPRWIGIGGDPWALFSK